MTEAINSVLFVCTGNICRSPTAEGVARRKLAEAGLGDRVRVDSAGTHGFHVGEAPDPRAIAAACRRGYELSGLRARKLDEADFSRFDLLLAMDGGHMAIMRRMYPREGHGRLQMFMRYAQHSGSDEVPDPYYGNNEGFEAVLSCCEDAVQGLIRHLKG